MARIPREMGEDPRNVDYMSKLNISMNGYARWRECFLTASLALILAKTAKWLGKRRRDSKGPSAKRILPV
jgi:hypothetical protein